MFSVSEQQFRACAIFRKAKRETIAQLIGEASPVRYEAKQQIYLQGDVSDSFHLLISGTVRAKGFSEDGKAVSFNEIGPGELFGEFGALDGGLRSADIVAVDQVHALRIPSALLRDAVENDGMVALSLLKSLVEKNRVQTWRLYELSVFAVRKRVQQEILRLAKFHPNDAESTSRPKTITVQIPTHQELADRLSTHREAVTRELSFLASNGLIEVTGAGLRIPDIERFAQFAGNLKV